MLIFLGILLIPLVIYLITSSCVQASFYRSPDSAALILYIPTSLTFLVKSASTEEKIYTRSRLNSYLRPEGFSFPSSVFDVIKIGDVLFLTHNLLTDEASSSVSCQITVML